jgi:hypothetical protein
MKQLCDTDAQEILGQLSCETLGSSQTPHTRAPFLGVVKSESVLLPKHPAVPF